MYGKYKQKFTVENITALYQTYDSINQTWEGCEYEGPT
jgi:hypothetical protein